MIRLFALLALLVPGVAWGQPISSRGFPPIVTHVQTSAVTANGSIGTLPANAVIRAIYVQETAGHAVTGGVNIGSTAAGTDIASAIAVSANALVVINPSSLSKQWFSASASQGMFISAASAWNSASVNVWVSWDQNTGGTYGLTALGGTVTGAFNVAGTLTVILPAADSTSLLVGAGAGTATAGASQQNTAFGYSALNAETSTAATAVGYNALATTTGHANTAFGASAGGSITTGTDNVAIGNDALLHNDGTSVSSASQNIAIGVHALSHSTTGNQNIAIGSLAMVGCGNWVGFPTCDLTGSANTVIGYHALVNVSGGAFENTIVGANAGGAVTTGTENIMLGSSAGSNLTTGSLNIMVGRDVRGTGATVSSELNIGNLIRGQGVTQGGDLTPGNIDINGTFTATTSSFGDTTTRTLVNGAPGKVTTAAISASSYNEVHGNWSANNSPAQIALIKSRNTTPGSHTIINTGDVAGLIAAYADDGTSYLNVGNLNWGVIGSPGTGSISTQAVIQTHGGASTVNSLILAGNTSLATFVGGITGTLATSGTIGGALCATAAPNSIIYSSGNTSCTISLAELKNVEGDISPLEAWSALGKLEPIGFSMKPRAGEAVDTRARFGFTAQGALAANPRLATYDGDGKLQGYDPNGIIAVLTVAVKDQQRQIDRQFWWLVVLSGVLVVFGGAQIRIWRRR